MTHPARHRAFLRSLAAVLLAIGAAGPAWAAPDCPPALQHTLPRLQDEKPVPLCT